MEISPGIEIVDLALYLHEHKALVISDLQLGYEEALNKRGILVPRFQYKDVVKRLEKIFAILKGKGYAMDVFVINGDVKHEFGRISDQEWREILKLLDFAGRFFKKIIIVKGNHDMYLAPIARKRDLILVDQLMLGDVLLIHGHEIPKINKKVKRIIIGHEHPAVTLREGHNKEQFKCFLKGKFKQRELVVLPSFNPILPGSDMLTEDVLSPFLADVKNFEVYVVEDKVYHFGKLKKIQR